MKRNRNFYEYLLYIAALAMLVWCLSGCQKSDGCGLDYKIDNVNYIMQKNQNGDWEQFDWKWCVGKYVRVYSKKTEETCNIWHNGQLIYQFTYPAQKSYEFTLTE